MWIICQFCCHVTPCQWVFVFPAFRDVMVSYSRVEIFKGKDVCVLTKIMEQSSSLETKSLLVKIFSAFVEPSPSFSCLKKPVIGPNPEPNKFKATKFDCNSQTKLLSLPAGLNCKVVLLLLSDVCCVFFSPYTTVSSQICSKSQFYSFSFGA